MEGGPMRRAFLAMVLLATSAAAQDSRAEQERRPPTPEGERTVVLAAEWTLSEATLSVTRGKRTWSFPVNLTRMAQERFSNELCAGVGLDQCVDRTRQYLDKLGKVDPRRPVLVELMNEKKGAPLYVRDVWQADFASQYQQGLQVWCPVLRLSAAEIRKMGSPAEYRRRVEELSERNWAALAKREKTEK